MALATMVNWTLFLAGTNKMRWPRFLVANTAGGIAWAAIYTAAGFFAGGVLERLSLTIDLVLGGIAALVIIGGIVVLRRRMAGLTKRAEKAYPGPLE
jgi:membrane protein DedA with SNARE-associated domain